MSETMTEKTEKTEKTNIQARNLAGILCILSFILSLPILASVIWLLYMRDFDCENLLRLPKLQFGISIGLLFIFLVSNMFVLLRSRFPMAGLLAVLVPLIVMLTMGLALVGAYKMESRTIPASPKWLKLKIRNDENWNNIKSCVYDKGACQDLASRSLTIKSYDFNMRGLSFIESGCCKPPTICGMKYVNATYWEKEVGAEDLDYPYDKDCDTWKNDPTILCYNCNTCKEGFLRTLKSKWWKLGIFLVMMALLLILAHLCLFFATMWERYGGSWVDCGSDRKSANVKEHVVATSITANVKETDVENSDSTAVKP